METSKTGIEDQTREDAKKKALERVKQKATIVNIDEIADKEARKAADAYMTESKGNANLFKRMWKHTFFDEYYRQRQINRVKEEIKGKENIYAGRLDEENSDIAHKNAMLGITERFQAEYDGTLSEGEEKKILNKDNPETIKVKNEITDLINKYASSEMNEAAFKNAKTRILDNIKDDTLNSAKNYADNLFEIAQNARLAIEHGAKMEELDYDLDIILGKAKSSLKTEAHYNLSDKLVDKMKRSKVGRFISPAVLSTGVGLAYSISIGVGSKLVRSKAAAIGTLGASVALSGLFAGMNESQRLAAERAQHEVEMAEGNTFKEGDKRREQMDKFRYETIKSTDLSNKLIESMFEKDKDSNLSPKDIKSEDVEKVMNQIAQIEARNSLNSKKKIDLISYSSVGSVEKERTDLTILTAKAKVELRKRIEGDLKNGIPEGEQSFDEYLKKKIQVVEDSLLGGEKGISAHDKAFRKFKAKRVAMKVLTTVTIGAIVGATVQEGIAFFKDDVQGFVENLVNSDSTGSIQTPIQHLSEWISGNHTHMDMGNMQQLGIGENGLLKYPEGVSILNHSDGTIDILRGDDIVSKNIPLTFNPDGTLDADSIARLGEDGIVVNTDHTLIAGTEEVTVPTDEYINNHGGDHEVNRIGWYDNDTPKPIFDQNELKLQWGGEAGSAGIDANGNYVFDVNNMTSGGSFTDGLSVDAQEQIKNGALSMIFSLTDGTQDHVFELPIGVDGKVIIDPNSEIGKLFFDTENGHAVFKGRFAEVVQSFGEKEGVEQIKSLATLVGDGNNSIQDIVETVTEESSNIISIPKDMENVMYIPGYVRSPLEPVSYKKERMLKRLGFTLIKKQEDKRDIKVEPRKDVNIIEEKEIYYITQEQYDAFKDDIKFINKKIQSSEGVAEIKESDLKSQYVKMRYNQLKHIQDGKPVTWNKEELQRMGDELEKILSLSVIQKEEKAEAKIEEQSKTELEKETKKEIRVEIKEKKIEDFIYLGSKIELNNRFNLITRVTNDEVEVISKNKETGVFFLESIKLKEIKKALASNLINKTEKEFIDFENEIENYNKKEVGGVLGYSDYYYKIVSKEKTLLGKPEFLAIEKNVKTGEIEIVKLKEEEIDEMLAPLEISSEEEKEEEIEERTNKPIEETIKKEKKWTWKGIWNKIIKKEREIEKLPNLKITRDGFEEIKQYKFKEIFKVGTVFVDYRRDKHKIISIEGKGKKTNVEIESGGKIYSLTKEKLEEKFNLTELVLEKRGE